MKWEKVGEIGVDAGLCWVGDPCYILHTTPGNEPKDLGKDWLEFCNTLPEENPVAKQYDEGVVVSTGYGDGSYPVYVKKNDEGRIVGVMVKFD